MAQEQGDYRIPRVKTNSILDEYEVQWDQKLGCGISGPVRPCRKKSTGESFALKCLLDRHRSQREINLHLQCSNHPNIVHIYDVYANEVHFPSEPQPKARLLVVMELMNGGELFDRIAQKKYFTERQAADYTRQIAAAIQRCHSLNIAHRDIKPENLLLKDNSEDAEIKLSDFGFAKVDEGNLTTPHFTPYYVAPQVLEAQRHVSRSREGYNCIMARGNSPYTYDKSCDMWSLGVIIYIMLCGYPPFYSETPSKQITRNMKRKIMAGEYEFPEYDWDHISHEAKDLVRSLLEVDPEKRLLVDEVLFHPWLQGAPETCLQSPAIMSDKNVWAEVVNAHSQHLTHLRLPDQQIILKPINQVNNSILKKRIHSRSNSIDNRHQDEPPAKLTPSSMAIQCLRDVIAHCILPPKDEAEFEEQLNFLVRKSCQCNYEDPALKEALGTYKWDGNQFRAKVDPQKLAHNLSRVVDKSCAGDTQRNTMIMNLS